MLRAPEKIKLTKEVFIENDEASKIEGMQFSMLSNDEVRKAAEADIWRGSYYDNLKKPVPNGLLEPKLGPANKMSGPCATCHANFKDCPGHYGSLTLALPVFHIGYFGASLEILKCICKSCSHILLNEKDRKELLKKMRNPKLDTQRKSEAKKKMVQKCSNKMITCFRCGYTNENRSTKFVGPKQASIVCPWARTVPRNSRRQQKNAYHQLIASENQRRGRLCRATTTRQATPQCQKSVQKEARVWLQVHREV